MLQSAHMKTYFFIVPSKGRVNTLLRNDIFKTLMLEQGAHAVVFSHMTQDKEFSSEFGQQNIIHRPLERVRISRTLRYFLRLRDMLLKIDSPILIKSSLIVQSVVKNTVVTKLSTRSRALVVLRTVLRPIRPFIAAILNAVEARALHTSSYAAAITEFQPRAIITGTLGVVQDDLVWLAHARSTGVPAVAVDLPWNYFEDRMLSLPRPAHVCVWNDAMAKRARDEFRIPESHLHVTGCVRYDFYAQGFTPANREAFAKRIKVDPSRPLIAFFLGSAPWHRTQEQVVELLLKDIQTGVIPGNPQLLIRFGPSEKPSAEFLRMAKEHAGDLVLNVQEDMPHHEDVANIIHYAAVTLSHFSSLALDAAVLNRPHAYVAFSGFEEPHPNDAPMARIFEFDFVKQATDTDGIQVVYSADELRKNIINAMNNPAEHAEGRKRLIKHYLGDLDGKAGRRIADVITRVTS